MFIALALHNKVIESYLLL